MKKNTIVQFVFFVTSLEIDDFIGKWENFSKDFMHDNGEMILQEQTSLKSKFKYFSCHMSPQEDFKFSQLKAKTAEHFPDNMVKVLHGGGYTVGQIEWRHQENKGLIKVMAFLGKDETDVGFYKQLPFHRYLNIYEAYYESCTYSTILEFFVEEGQVMELTQQLKGRSGVDTGIYKESLV